MRKLLALAALLLSGGCALFKQPDHFEAHPVAFDRLSGWPQDDQAAALQTFIAGCGPLSDQARPESTGSGIEVPVSVWRSLCGDARRVPANDAAQARAFFERRFTPYRITNNGRERGLFTGYYEPVLYGSPRKHGDFQYALYRPPPELAHEKPYFTHAEINQGALQHRHLELLWVDDPVMLFFTQIQGSGRVHLSNGKQMLVGYADKNGQPYQSLGKIMGDEGLIPMDQINFFSLRQWLYQHPDQAFAMMEKNPSYVFFQKLDTSGPVGAAGAVLTPERSLAVDNHYIPYGLPLFLETELPAEPQRAPTPFHRLMVAQDTGGAIRGPVRGDIFFGTGDAAEYYAGYMKGRGVYTLFIPNEIINQVKFP